AKRRIGEYCDGVMIGRAALQNPLIFSEREPADEKERVRIIVEYCELCEETVLDMQNMKLVLSQMTKGMSEASSIREKLMGCKNPDEIILLVKGLYERY
ncbi:MAG: tRNA-dihydrouridine synthase, partial [Candidatus Micrarchaeota archaeon]|nr:tRNA-dihydrouridine synthase [Candidatus Micrarchaeota archaeon]